MNNLGGIEELERCLNKTYYSINGILKNNPPHNERLIANGKIIRVKINYPTQIPNI
jgi:hypothetical protein